MRTTPKFRLLRGLDVLSGIPERRLRDLEFHVDEVDVATGDVLIRQGQLNHHAYLVASGMLGIDVDGMPVATVGAGSIVGERTAIAHGLANATVTVVQPAHLLTIDHRVLVAAATDSAEFGEQLQLLADQRTNDIAA